MTSGETVQVLIIGAGATGLLIAQGLKRANISVAVFEQHSLEKYVERAGVWSMALHWATPNVEACLPPELFARLNEAQTDPWAVLSDGDARTIPLMNGKTGELLTYVKAEGPRRVQRGRLRDLFGTGLDIQFGMKLDSVSVEGDTVTATFNDGVEVRRGRYLVGADGPRSKVRSLLVPVDASELHPAPVTILSFACSFDAEKARYLRSKIHPIATLAPHPDQKTYFFITLADVPDADKPEGWLFSISLSIWNEGQQPQTYEERSRLFKQLAANYCEPWKYLAEWVGDDVKIPLDRFATWKNIQPWKNYDGRMTIAGDAAHPMVPYRAQGLNNALEDAGRYVQAITEVINANKDPATVVGSYNADVYKRGKDDISGSDEQMYACHHWEALSHTPLLTDGFNKRK
ncbi:FAD/NAD(P)-binding domain-containing protein [Alternaria alternata]|uniref:FAD/NAD(P)-binding domain-containing protein n=1 Tax=Alternaria alternata TaxID=5599 RepID=A0A177D223_ALTAL|nr:FAD/NAD(P)-binding domain-containing protein [Alternaria alternata]OAG13242.1 FAD/NAD(P)-binding domain-containing protein [Alternaria alternata]